jgi:hypothetical protein
LLNQHHRQEEPMDATWIITAFVVIDTLMERLGHRSDVRAQVPDSEILTIAVVAATYVGSHHERAAPMMRALGSLSGRISVSRFNRRLHQLADGMSWIPDVLGEVFTTGDVFIIDSLPLPVCRRVRARRLPTAPGAHAAGSARRNGRRSLDGVCIWSAARMACPCAFRCCPQGCMT